MRFSEDLLVESKSARNEGISELAAQTSEQDVLNKVKALLFAVWDGKARVSRQQLADFYEVPVATIDSNAQRHSDEFELDGVKVFRGKDLSDVRRILHLTSKSPQETIYTPAGALRMGFILRDSQIAKQVRTMTIRVIQGVGALLEPQIALTGLLDMYAGAEYFADESTQLVKISAPLLPHYEAIRSALKRKYANGGIPGISLDKIREMITLLAAYTDSWKLQTDKEITKSHSNNKFGYPHLTSDPFFLNINGEMKRGVIMFQFCDPLVDDKDIEVCDGLRNYIQSAKSSLNVDAAWLFFVSPFGATPDAVSFIEKGLRSESQGFVGVLLVNELVDFLVKQATQSRRSNFVVGEINQKFKQLTGYQIPDSPLDLLMEYQIPIEGV